MFSCLCIYIDLESNSMMIQALVLQKFTQFKFEFYMSGIFMYSMFRVNHVLQYPAGLADHPNLNKYLASSAGKVIGFEMCL